MTKYELILKWLLISITVYFLFAYGFLIIQSLSSHGKVMCDTNIVDTGTYYPCSLAEFLAMSTAIIFFFIYFTFGLGFLIPAALIFAIGYLIEYKIKYDGGKKISYLVWGMILTTIIILNFFTGFSIFRLLNPLNWLEWLL